MGTCRRPCDKQSVEKGNAGIAAIEIAYSFVGMDMLLAMRIYVRVVERGSLSAAARDLGMSQPTVSERVSRLEKHLGSRLLHRNTRSLSPTDIGVIFYERSKKTLASAAFAESISVSRSVALRGTLRIAAPHTIGEVVLPEILHRFRRHHPHLAIDLILNDRIVDPVTEGVDVSIRLGDVPSGTNIDDHIGYVKRVLVASPDYVASYGEPKAPEEIVAHPFLRVTGIFNDGTVPLQSNEQTIHAPVNVLWTVSNWRPLHALLLHGAGIGVLQAPAASEGLASGRLKRLMPQYVVPEFKVRILYPNSDPLPEKTKKIVAFLKQELRFYSDEPQAG
jgi:DNA-binding transcriptional LysR family regulator